MKKHFIPQILYALCLGVFLTFGCKDSSTGNSEDPEGLDQEFLIENEIGDWKTKVKDVVQTNDGIVIIGAYREESGGCSDNLYLAKINDEGEQVWLKKFNDLKVSSCNAIQLQQTVTNGFIAFATTPSGSSSIENDYFIMKFTTAGDLMWTKRSGENDIFWQLHGLETRTGEFVAYTISSSSLQSSSNDRLKLTFNQNGTLLSEESNNDYDGELDEIIQTPDNKYIFNIRNESGSSLIIKDRNLNTLASSRIDDQRISYVNEVQESNSGYIAQTSTSVLKLDSEFNIEWRHNISSETNERGDSGLINGNNIIEIGDGFYGFIEREPHNVEDDNLVSYGKQYLTILNSSGEVTNTQEVGGGGEFFLATTQDQNVIVISRDLGLKIQAFRTTDIIK